MSTIIQWRCFAPTEEDDQRLQYARYVMIGAVIAIAIGLVLCITVNVAGLALVLLALVVIFAVIMLNCYVSMKKRQERLDRHHRQPEAAAVHTDLYPETTTPINTGDSWLPDTSNGGLDAASVQTDLPTYHEAGFQQYPVVPAPDVPPPRPVADNNEPPPPSYEDAVSSGR
uniref:Uncharacterized protein n=1 Tax=Branchiostoma floridae TaxID=7739 RepID=C3Z706_BRAFL|eukprot:XP_002595590.1 hypothetical protein BRAFLDRAFT_64700 [Branchiostoma floridae]